MLLAVAAVANIIGYLEGRWLATQQPPEVVVVEVPQEPSPGVPERGSWVRVSGDVICRPAVAGAECKLNVGVFKLPKPPDVVVERVQGSEVATAK